MADLEDDPGEESARIFREAIANLRRTSDVPGYDELPDLAKERVGRVIAGSLSDQVRALMAKDRSVA